MDVSEKLHQAVGATVIFGRERASSALRDVGAHVAQAVSSTGRSRSSSGVVQRITCPGSA